MGLVLALVLGMLVSTSPVVPAAVTPAAADDGWSVTVTLRFVDQTGAPVLVGDVVVYTDAPDPDDQRNVWADRSLPPSSRYELTFRRPTEGTQPMLLMAWGIPRRLDRLL